ncbi:MAG: hypothetical protein JWM99_365 [Verrucomicrobiales bacterium]|nr:hypothetical protein [Verrucomicrobiales bacterium]
MFITSKGTMDKIDSTLRWVFLRLHANSIRSVVRNSGKTA